MLEGRSLLASTILAGLSAIAPLTALAGPVTTPQEWMANVLQRYEHKFGDARTPRRVSYNPDDWPANSGDLIRLNQFDAPLLKKPSFVEPNLQITGIGRKGEVFQLVEWRKLLFLSNPLSDDWKAPNGNGIWAKIRGIDGTEGWIFAGTEEAPMNYLSWARRMEELSRTPLSDQIILVLCILALVAIVISTLHRWSSRSPQNVQTLPVSSSSSSSSDYSSDSGSSCSGGSGGWSAHEETEEEETDGEENDDEEIVRPGGLGLEMRKCPDCDGDHMLFPQDYGNGVCSECHGTGRNLDPLVNEACPMCHESLKCQTCRGKGWVRD